MCLIIIDARCKHEDYLSSVSIVIYNYYQKIHSQGRGREGL